MKSILTLITFLSCSTWVLSQTCEAIFSYDASSSEVSFVDLSSYGNNDQIISWSWDFDGLGNSSLQNPTFTFPEPEKYDVILTINTQNGCSSTIEIRIEICSLNVNFSLGACDASGLIPIDITINDVYDNADEIDITIDGQPITGSPFLIDIDNPVIINDMVEGNGITRTLSVISNDVSNCGQDIEIPVEDCNSDCFLSGIQASLSSANSHVIEIGDNFFSPSSIAVDIGDLITFNWVGDGHSTTSDATTGIDSWNSGVLGIGSSFETIIDNPGTHQYYCIPHGAPGGVGMSAEILANCPNGTSLNIKVSFNTTLAGSGGFNILIDGQEIAGSPFEYIGTGTQSQILSIPGDNNDHIIEVIDVDDPTCTLSMTYSSPDCNQGGGEPVCNLSVDVLSLGNCNANNEVPVQLEIIGSNTGNSFNISVDNGPVQNFLYTGNNTSVEFVIPGDGLVHSITATDDNDLACTAEATVTSVDCSLPCSITNLTATPPSSDGSPSGIIHQINVEDFQFSPTTINISAGDQVQWVWTGDIDHTSTSDATTGNNSWDSGLLSNGATFTSPVLDEGSHPYYCIPHGGPGGQGMSGTINVLPACNENNEIPVIIGFNIQSAGNAGFNILIDGVQEGPFSYMGGSAQSVTVNFPGDGQQHSIEVVDIDSGTCNATTTLVTNSCTPVQDPCSLIISATQNGNCTENMISFEVTVSSMNAGNSFSSFLDGTLAGSITYDASGTTVFSIDVPGDASQHTIQVIDDNDVNCTATTTITSIDCSLPCSIANLTATPPSSDGSTSGIIHQVNVEDFQFSPATINISAGDQVQWVWAGDIDHTSTSDATTGNNSWDSGLLSNGATFTSPVLDEGSHPYYCIPHGGPGGQGMSGTINVLPACNPDGTVDVEISFDIQSPGVNGYTIFVDGESVSTHPYSAGSNQNIIVPVIADGLSHDIEIKDNDESTCAASVEILTPMCNDISCGLNITHTQPSDCNEGLVTISLELQSGLTNSDFEVLIDGIFYGLIITLEDGSNTFDLDLRGRGNDAIITVRNLADLSCSESITVTLPECNVECIIQEIVIDTSSFTHIIEVRDFEFFPKDVSILVGDTLRFIWVGDIPHTVTSDQIEGVDSWDSGLWGQNHVYNLVIQNAGQHPYYCIPHGGPGGIGMAGTINALDTCEVDSSYQRVNVVVAGGSSLGFFWYLDGTQQSEIPINYEDLNGKNSFVFKWPADGEPHTLTVQDSEIETCARSINLVAEICDTTCIVSNLSTLNTDEVVHKIEVRDFDFFPKDITIRVGEKIRFTWIGDIPHTTTSDAIEDVNAWNSNLLGKGAVFEIEIDTPGDHPYYCIPHGGPGGIGMAGNISVLPLCDEGLTSMVYSFDVRNGSSLGYNIFIDGNQVSDVPTSYDNINGNNSGALSVPGDGQQHILTIQDVETSFCAFSNTFLSPQCVDTCSITGLSYIIKTAKRDTVLVKDFEFFPKDISVETGDTILFIWEGDIPHTVTSDTTTGNSAFNSGLLGKEEMYTLILKETGTHPYYCIPHGGPGGLGMAGTITVNEKCEDGALDFVFTFFTEGNGTAYSVLLNGETAIDIKDYNDGPFQSFDLPIEGNNQVHAIKVVDLSIPDCEVELLIPGFDCDDPCINLQAGFNINVDPNTNTVTFNDNSQGSPNNWTWDLGNGDMANGSEITYTYQGNETYEVCLTVERDDGCASTYCDKVNLNEKFCEVSYYYTFDGLNITFTNTSTISDTLVDGVWNFGDGSNLPLSDMVSHEYQPGIYEVCLLVTSTDCNALFCDTLDLTDPCLAFEADFNFQVDSDDDLKLSFFDMSTGSSNQWLWGFGDGNTIDVKDPVHNFSSPGTYSVCLLAQDTNTPCSDAYCRSVVVGSSAVEDIGSETQRLTIFPNPIHDHQNEIFITGFRENDFGKKATISMYNLNGIIVFQDNENIQSEISIHPSKVSPGMYIINILTENGSYSEKLLIL